MSSTTDTPATTVRLTVGQAIVKFLGQQYSERDGIRRRFFAGCFGIFGHGNVAGIGQALLQAELDEPGQLPYHQGRNEQAMVHIAVGLLAPEGSAGNLCRHRLRRSRCGQHADRRRTGDRQPHPGAAAAG